MIKSTATLTRHYDSRSSQHNPTAIKVLIMLVTISVSIAIGIVISVAPIKLSLMALIAVIAIICCYVKPEYVLYLSIVALIITTETIGEELSNSGGGFIIEDIKIMKGIPPITISMLLLLFAVYFTKQILVERQTSTVPFKYLFFYAPLLLLALVTGLQNGADPMDIKNDFIRFIYPILCFYLCVNILNNCDKNIYMIWVVFIACLVKTAIIDVNYLSGRGVPYDDNVIVTSDSAVLMAVGFMIALGCALALYRSSMKGFTIVLLGLLPMVFALVFSFRRGHWIGQVAALAVFYFWVPQAYRRKLALSVFAIGLVTALIYSALTGKLFEAQENRSFMLSRIESIFDPDQHSNKHHYLESITTLKDIMQQPLTGMGLGGIHSPVPDDVIDWPGEGQPLHVVHNTFVHIWMKLGLPGLCFFIWVGAVYLRILNEYRKSAVYNASWPYIAAIGSGVGIWFVMFMTAAVPWSLHQTFLIALFSAIGINLISIGHNRKTATHLVTLGHCE